MVKIIAHRGNDSKNKYPENTKDAILNALAKDYVDGVEFDVRLTKDKQFVIAHDNQIAPTSNGSGLISDMTLKELRQYNFGTVLEPRYIDTLEGVLKEITGTKIINIEVKEETKRYKKVANLLYRLLQRYDALNLYISSFNHDFIRYFYKKYDKMKVGLLVGIKKNLDMSDRSFDFYAVSILNYKRFLEYPELFVWTVNNISVAHDIIKKRDKELYLITDKASELKDLRRTYV